MSVNLNKNHIILGLLLCIVLYFVYKNYNEHMDAQSETQSESQFETKLHTETVDNKPTLGVYYTTWCGYSRNFLEQLNNGLLNDLQNAGVDVKLVDCDKDKQTCSDLGIQGFPTLLLHKNNKIIPYNEPRRENENVLNFVKNN